jgi:hypothetical protein
LHENIRHEELLHEGSGEAMELDIFLPKECLAFEYQGEQHYWDVYGLGNQWERKQRDKEKREACIRKGITLIEIPFWWDKSISSLAATIHQYRKDLNISHVEGKPIPITLPPGFLAGINKTIILSKGGTPELMHGEDWDGDKDLTGW